MERTLNNDNAQRAVPPEFERSTLSTCGKIDQAEKERMELVCLRETMLQVRAFCHDFSQPLMVMVGYAELMALSRPPGASDHFKGFRLQIEKINQLYTELRNTLLSCRQKIHSIEKNAGKTSIIC